MDAEVIYAFIISLSCLCVIIVTLNTAVCLLVYLNKNIRTYTNGFVVSLAISDILTGGFFFPLHLAAPDFPGLPYMNSIAPLLGVANVCCVTYDRYLSISSPLTYRTDIRKRFKTMIILCWTVPVVFSFIPLLWDANPTCLAHTVYIYVLEICGIIIPYIFIFSIYTYIFKQVRKCNERLNMDFVDQKTMHQRKRRLFSEAKVARVFVTVAVLFLLSWSPILYITTALNIGRPDLVPASLQLLAFYMLALGSLVNPILYCFLKPDIKAIIKKMISRTWQQNIWVSFNRKSASANIFFASNNSNSKEGSRGIDRSSTKTS